MTNTQKINKVKTLTGETDEALLLTYLDLAGSKILQRVYPYDPTKITVPTRYESNQIEIAVFLFNKRGAEGETYHSENGINRSYETASVPDSMLESIVPHIGTF